MKKSIAVLMSLMMALSVSACGSSSAASSSAAETTTAASGLSGSYTETVKGRNADMSVTTTFTDGKITSVEVGDNEETEGIGTQAIDDVPGRIVEANSLAVDASTGATITSDAIKEAVAAAITEAGGDPAEYGYGQEASAESSTAAVTSTKELSADVVVVGAGGAGLSAALTAQDDGASVILLEKAANVGGVSVIAGGPMGIDSQDQKEAGATDFTVQDVLNYWQSYNCWMDNGQLFYNVSSRSGETIDWLEDEGMLFTFVGNAQSAHKDGYPTYHIFEDQDNKAAYFQTLADKFVSLGGQLYMETPATELIADGDRVTGVKALSADGTEYDISCKAVVLATGGFAGNKEMMEEKIGWDAEAFTTGTQTGDGATMSQAIGAGVGKTIQQWHGVTSFSGIQTGQGKDEIAKAIYMPTSVWVNQSAARFAPEDLNYDTALCSNAAATQGDHFFSIMSDDMVKAVEEGGAQELGVTIPVAYEPTIPMFSIDEPWTEFRAALEDGVNNGLVFKGNTVEELAENMGVDAATLKQTIEQYNAYCDNGKDEVYGKDAQYLKSLGEGPYYAVKAQPVSLGGIGGVLVNSNLNVIKDDGKVINGLYAAGADVAEIYNNSYPLVEGVTMMMALTGGRLAGEQAAALAQGKTAEEVRNSGEFYKDGELVYTPAEN